MNRLIANGAPRFDGSKQVLDAQRAPPFPVLQPLKATRIARFQREDILRALDGAVRIQFFDALFAEPFDIEGVARDEMLEALARLCRTDQAASAATHRIFLAGARIHLAHSVASASRTNGRKDIGHRIGRSLFQHHVEHFGNHVAGALNDDRVADADVDAVANFLAVAADAADVILVVQSRVRDDDAADRDGPQSRQRIERTGPADIDLDGVEDCRRLLRGKFVRQRPARRPRHEAEARLQREVVDLVDDAVDVVAELGAIRLDGAVVLEQFGDAGAKTCQRDWS